MSPPPRSPPWLPLPLPSHYPIPFTFFHGIHHSVEVSNLFLLLLLLCVHCLSSLKWKLLERFCCVLIFTPESPVPRTGLGSVAVQTPWTAAHQASLSITNSRSLLRLMSIKLVMPSNHLTLCCPLLLLPSILPSIGVSSKEFFASGGQSIGAQDSASVLPVNIHEKPMNSMKSTCYISGNKYLFTIGCDSGETQMIVFWLIYLQVTKHVLFNQSINHLFIF